MAFHGSKTIFILLHSWQHCKSSYDQIPNLWRIQENRGARHLCSIYAASRFKFIAGVAKSENVWFFHVEAA